MGGVKEGMGEVRGPWKVLGSGEWGRVLSMEIKRDEQMQVGGKGGREESRAECHRGGNQQCSLHTGPNNKGQPG